ncbi:MAG: hypothetical protein V4484_06935 [Pseudomonadota bacterium]
MPKLSRYGGIRPTAVTWKKAAEASQFAYAPIGTQKPTNVELMKHGLACDRADDARGDAAAELNYSMLPFEMTNGNDAGDGTVPANSGAAPHRFAPSCVRAQLAVTGVDHQGAYSTRQQAVMDFVAFSVCKISKDAT